jgi:Leucine-rich repeat (LRR) protein
MMLLISLLMICGLIKACISWLKVKVFSSEMAIVGPHEASSSASQCDHDVFLSFRGEDTRTTFTDHLYAALISAGFQTFRDNEGIERGENINSELQQAIQRAKISIVVISKNYASSRWCLDELVLILHCRKTKGHVVLPLFYHVHPSHIKKEIGSFAEAFKVHEKTESTSKLEEWRAALKEVSELGGMEIHSEAHVYESEFIQKAVTVVQDKLCRTPLNEAPYLVGVDASIGIINKWLRDESTEVPILIIHGMGGIGKTTIAKCLYNLNYQRFGGSSFLANVREYSQTSDGLTRLQQNLLSDILRGRKEDIRNVDEGIIKIKNALCCKKILLVLDDVDQTDQVDAILGMQNWLCRGSKVILTTRNDRLLIKPRQVYERHEVEILKNHESLELFSWHAFGQNHPTDGFFDISKRVVNYCGGLPLALELFGRSLSGRSVDIWESAVQKLKAIPNSQIVGKLKISYDGLPDRHDKDIFLYIACFFVGEDKDKVISVLNCCGYFTEIGLQSLIDRCLLTINKDNKISMHQLLQEMGRDIICQESPEPEKRSILCHHNDCIDVLRKKTGTDKIIGISLSLFVSTENNQAEASISRSRNTSNFSSSPRDQINFQTNAFARMHNLKLLQLDKVHLGGDYKKLPQELRWIHWHRFNSESLPPGFSMEKLVSLDMQHSMLKQIWKGKKLLGNLKFLDLSYSPFLESTPDFSGIPNLERLSLRYCIQLTEIHGSIGKLRTLLSLDLEGCKDLEKLPKYVNELKSLEKIILAGCSKLHNFPFDLQKLVHLTVFNADGVSFSSQRSKTLKTKSLGRDGKKDEIILEHFKNILTSFCSSLETLSLADCNLSDDDLPKDMLCLSSLRSLNLEGNNISTLPESIKNLTKLQELVLDGCKRLKSIPPLPTSLRHIKMQGCKSLIVVPSDEDVFMFDSWMIDKDSQLKVGPIENIDAEVINRLGLLNVESIINVNVNLLNRMTITEGKVPIQGVYEFGIYSIFLPRSEVPDWFSYKTQGSSLCFDVPCMPNAKVAALSICTVYSWLEKSSDNSRWHYMRDELWIEVKNNSKGLKWNYHPTYVGRRGDEEEDMTWLCHSDFGGKIESKDNVTISVCIRNDMQVKEIGVHVMDKQCQSTAAGANLSYFEVSQGVYVLKHYRHNFIFQSSSVRAVVNRL